ncbi:MAG: TolC family protein [Prevotella sp.]|nr:TolC family protein [Prevotella sp.]
MKRVLIGLSFILFHFSFSVAQSLEECQQAAEHNYPLIKQYGLIEKTTELTVANIQKGWLPQVSASAQATLQSDVTAFPNQMQAMYKTMGIEMEGLKKDQYRVGIDVQQTVFDGGAIKSQKEIARQQGEVQYAQNEVNLYNVRKRVNEMYFGLLLIDEQIKLNQDLQDLLATNEKKLASMLKGGTAAESDYLNVKAERLNVVQQATSLQAQRQALVRMLSAFCGRPTPGPSLNGGEIIPVKPDIQEALNYLRPSIQGGEGYRPELRALDAQLRLADVQEKSLDAALKPKLGVFAQGFYGYPGYNMFEDMMGHKWSLNGMIGARLTWNIGGLYTRKNDKAKLNAQRSMFTVQRETFLFNNNLEQILQNENIERYRKLMNDDEEIISLRSSIRKAAESKLSHGIIDVNDLVKEINAENAARVQQTVHEIEMLKEVYDLRYTLNIEH